MVVLHTGCTEGNTLKNLLYFQARRVSNMFYRHAAKISYFPQNATSIIIYSFQLHITFLFFCKVLKFKYKLQYADPIISMKSPSFHG
jgi:hypothetical protein